MSKLSCDQSKKGVSINLQATTCPSGQICIVRELPCPSTNPSCTKAQRGFCVDAAGAQLKSGTCPTPTVPGQCVVSCVADGQCAAALKCCFNGCGVTCLGGNSGGLHSFSFSAFCVDLFSKSKTFIALHALLCMITKIGQRFKSSEIYQRK